MPREPELAIKIEAAELIAFNELLCTRMASNEAAIPHPTAGTMKSTFSKNSQESSVKLLNSFKREIEYSTYRSNTGKPIKVGERKPSSDSARGEAITQAEAKEKIDRKTSKK